MDFSPVDQMNRGTADADIFAYFWHLLEHKSSFMVVGEAASGKTSLLSTLVMMIPSDAKVAKIAAAATNATASKATISDMLKESYRQAPDYVVAGEIGGQEACLFFQGMGSGHASMATFKAESVEEMARRLVGKPIGMPASLVKNVDVVILMTNAEVDGRPEKRIKEIAEIEGVDARTGEVRKRIVFRWNEESDRYERVAGSIKAEKIAAADRASAERAHAEIEKRKKFLTWMKEQNITDARKTAELLNLYSKELVGMRAETETADIENKIGKKERKVSILQVLLAKLLKERKRDRKKI